MSQAIHTFITSNRLAAVRRQLEELRRESYVDVQILKALVAEERQLEHALVEVSHV
jgi:hypothetical protein